MTFFVRKRWTFEMDRRNRYCFLIDLPSINYLFIDIERWYKNVVKEITIYETFDGTRFDSLHEANNYEELLKNQAISDLCNHDYDGWEDYMFTKSKETN